MSRPEDQYRSTLTDVILEKMLSQGGIIEVRKNNSTYTQGKDGVDILIQDINGTRREVWVPKTDSVPR